MYAKLLKFFESYIVIPWLGLLSDKLYGFSSDKDQYRLIPIKQSKKVRCILLSREHYQEIQKDYPVESKKELTKIINLELASNPEQKQLYRIGAYLNKKRTVTFAQLNDSVFEQTAQLSRFFCIPESWFLGAMYDSTLLKVNSQNFYYWLFSTKAKVQSYQCKGVFAESSTFCAAVGINNELPEVALSQQEVCSLFLKKYFVIILEHFSGLVVRKHEQRSIEIKKYTPVIISCVLSLFIYNLTISFYLENKLLNLEGKQKILMRDAGELFTLQKNIQEKAEQITVINNTLSSSAVSIEVWRTLLPLFQESKLKLNKVTALSNHTVKIMGEAPKATKILEIINKQPNIQNSYFYTDVVKRNGKEKFTISYTMIEAIK